MYNTIINYYQLYFAILAAFGAGWYWLVMADIVTYGNNYRYLYNYS